MEGRAMRRRTALDFLKMERKNILSGSPCDTLPFSGAGISFVNTAYTQREPKQTESYKILSPIRGNGTPPERQISVFEYAILRARKTKLEKARLFQAPSQEH